ncbi:MAG: riboflavin kinase [Patescibacteria group bacterium]|nr:riboflavin kinase [Patescibacteria group bacterium]
MKPLFIYWGKVIGGAKRGKGLGYPTANVRLHKKIPEGIYASEVRIGKKAYHAATFVGSAKTFGEHEYKSESFVLNFNEFLYGKWIRVRLYKKLRENKAFASADELKMQMEKDIQNAKSFLANL